MTIRKSTWMALATAGIAALLMQGCATPTQAPEDVVGQRATQRWKLLVDGKLDQAYDYLAPSTRAILSLDSYKAELSGPVKWVAGDVVSVKCQADKCDARIRLEASAILGPRLGAKMPNIVTYFDEPWLKEEGQWWFFQKL